MHSNNSIGATPRGDQAPAHRLVSMTDTRARLGGMCRQSIYNLIDRGLLTRVKIGSRSFIVEQSINDLIASGIASGRVA